MRQTMEIKCLCPMRMPYSKCVSELIKFKVAVDLAKTKKLNGQNENGCRGDSFAWWRKSMSAHHVTPTPSLVPRANRDYRVCSADGIMITIGHRESRAFKPSLAQWGGDGASLCQKSAVERRHDTCEQRSAGSRNVRHYKPRRGICAGF